MNLKKDKRIFGRGGEKKRRKRTERELKNRFTIIQKVILLHNFFLPSLCCLLFFFLFLIFCFKTLFFFCFNSTQYLTIQDCNKKMEKKNYELLTLKEKEFFFSSFFWCFFLYKIQKIFFPHFKWGKNLVFKTRNKNLRF